MGETDVTDGRTSRAARTRTAIVDALLALIDQGKLRPTARQIADEAEVSLRSVYVHFDDLESLYITAAARFLETIQRLRGPAVVTGTLDERLAALVDRQRRTFERAARVRRASLAQEPFSPALRQAHEAGFRPLRHEIERVFAPELAQIAEEQRPRLVVALVSVTHWGMWETLHGYQHLPLDETAALIDQMARGVLRGWGVALPSAQDPTRR